MMSADEIVRRLTHWQKRHDEMMAQYNALKAVTDATPESPLMNMVFRLWDAYTVAVSEIIGDQGEWLNWYEMDCDMGARPKNVRIPGKKILQVKTLRQLAQAIKTGERA